MSLPVYVQRKEYLTRSWLTERKTTFKFL